MGHFRMEVAGGVVGTAKGKTFTLSDANVNRLAAWAQARYTTGNGSPVVPTVNQALVMWADEVFNRTRSDILSYERAQAAIANEPADFIAS
jgi:L-aminopeptidase/D-esterase-like protein